MKKIKLGDVSEIRNGSTPSTAKPENYGGQISWATPKDLSDNPEKYFYQGARNISEEGANSIGGKPLPKDSILLTSRAPIGLLAINKKETFTNQGFKSIIVDKKKVSEEYLFYFLKNNISNLINLGGGTTFKEISKSVLEQIEFYIPSLSKQKNIAKILSDIDSMISLNKKINEELEQMACQIYEYWFLQFDFPDRNGGPYKSSGGKMVYNQELKREIPEGWRVKKLGDIGIKVIRGVSFSKKDIVEKNKNSIGILRGTNISGNQIDVNNLLYVDKRFITEEQKIKAMDLLITMSSGSKEHVGKNGFYYFDKKDISFGAFLSKIVIPEKYRFLIGIYFQTKNFKTYLDNQILGTSINNVSNEMISSIKICVPSEQILSHFENLVKPIFQKIMRNMQQSQELVELRDYLLPLLMNGQINVD